MILNNIYNLIEESTLLKSVLGFGTGLAHTFTKLPVNPNLIHAANEYSLLTRHLDIDPHLINDPAFRSQISDVGKSVRSFTAEHVGKGLGQATGRVGTIYGGYKLYDKYKKQHEN